MTEIEARLQQHVLSVLASADVELSRAALQNAAGFHDREHFVNEHLNPLLAVGLIEMTIPAATNRNSA